MGTKENDPFPHEKLVKLLASKMKAGEFEHLCVALNFSKSEIQDLKKIKWKAKVDKEERVLQMLSYFLQKSNLLRKNLSDALIRINFDLAKIIFPGNNQISPVKKNEPVSTVGKKQNSTPENDKDPFPYEKLVKLLASKMKVGEFEHLCVALNFSKTEIQELKKVTWKTNSEERVSQMLNVFLQGTLVKALISINRYDLVETILLGNNQISPIKKNEPGSTVEKKQNSKPENDKDFKIFSQLASRIREDDADQLFKRLGIPDNIVNDVMNLPWRIGFHKKICTLLQQWKRNHKNNEWKNDLIEALNSIDRLDIITELFLSNEDITITEARKKSSKKSSK